MDIIKTLLVSCLIVYSKLTYAACSVDYKGQATINEIGMDKQNFIEIKLLDSSILFDVYQAWSVRVCNADECSTFLLSGITTDNSAYLVVTTTKNLPTKHKIFDVILQDADGNTIDYFSVDYTSQQDLSCTLDFDWQVPLSNTHNYRRIPDGTGDWEGLDDHGFDYTQGSNNDGDITSEEPLEAGYCNTVFVNGATSHASDGKIKVENSPTIFNDPSGTLATKQLEVKSSNELTCENYNGGGISKECTASGTPTNTLVFGEFVESSSKSALNVSTTMTIGENGENSFDKINMENGGVLNFSQSFNQYLIEELSDDGKNQGISIINLVAGDYYIGKLTLKADTTINIVGDGQVRIFLREDSEFNGSIKVNTEGEAEQLLVYGYKSIKIKTTTEIKGLIYSKTNVELTDSVKLTGAVSAGTELKITDTAKIYYECNDAVSDPVINHYQIIHDGSGLTCDAETVIVKACTNAYDGSCTLSDEPVTLDVKAEGSSSVTDSISFTGSGTASIPYTLAETTALSLENVSIAAINSTVCLDSDATSCDLVFSDTGFRFINGSSGSSETIENQIAGTSFPVSLQAVKNSNGVCTGLFTDNKNIDLSQENVDPEGSDGLSFTMNGSDIAKYPAYTPDVTLNFGANSIATLPTPIYHDAGEIRLHAYYDVGGVTLSGSSNSFWVSPAELVVTAKSGATLLNGSTATAMPTYKAGENFDFTVTAYNAATPSVITPNYSPGQIQFKLERTGPTLSDSVNGDLTFTATSTLTTSTSPVFQNVTLSSFSSGVSTYNSAQYSEVGLLNLDVQDSDFGNVGIIIPATAIDIGRFIPEHFEQTVADHGFFLATCNTGTTFAYSGQKDEATNSIGAISYLTNPILEITAYNKQADITQNYYEDSQGSVNDYMKLSGSGVSVTSPTEDEVAVDVDTNKLTLTANMNMGTLSQNDLTTIVPDDNPLPKGVLHYQLSDDDNFFYNRSANALVAPFISDINFSTATIIDADTVNVTTTVDASPTGVEIRFGRLLLENSFGPETSNIPQQMNIEHFDGAGFVVTSNNDCVSYNADNMSLTNISLDPLLTNVLGGTGNFFLGKTRAIELEATGAKKQGKLGVSYDIYDWLKFDWDNSGSHDQNPSATATFGLYRGNDRIIYRREVFN